MFSYLWFLLLSGFTWEPGEPDDTVNRTRGLVSKESQYDRGKVHI